VSAAANAGTLRDVSRQPPVRRGRDAGAAPDSGVSAREVPPVFSTAFAARDLRCGGGPHEVRR